MAGVRVRVLAHQFVVLLMLLTPKEVRSRVTSEDLGMKCCHDFTRVSSV